ncbi:hypothetical protein NAL32_17405 [Chryseobacterium sp. Ch-15]|uniref:Lipoprotein n=1 Tax=Chryseobacterium muglaense TaxID=2893752 RepID=A0A9Q3UYQ5_9FLAO|nr:hypothetical protein [Chryseobacterium muglaense]MBD3906451.1 hypothetical protein [Chryseobacterium muglaense]MCC9036837.1 hypothetical protein [Chryseobacterium muglaense]MCM2556163.1 hypothetical protein [Chryseobacterium muglaense]
MKKIIPFTLLMAICLSCSKKSTAADLQVKNKIIDSLRDELRDCRSQAQIMADVLEKERIEEQKKKDSH